MRSHLWFLTVVHAIRALGGLALAFVFFYYSVHANIPRRPSDLNLSRYHQVQTGDLEAFYAIAVVLTILASIRLFHSAYSATVLCYTRKDRSRRGLFAGRWLSLSRWVGLALAALDLIDLTFFPITTACGLYGVLVYRDPATVDFFEARYSPV